MYSSFYLVIVISKGKESPRQQQEAFAKTKYLIHRCKKFSILFSVINLDQRPFKFLYLYLRLNNAN